MAELFSNLAESSTAGAINNTTDPVTFSVTTGTGGKYPSAAVGSTDYFHAIVDSGTDVEVLRCQRNGDSITADRAQEGTAKVAHVAGVKFAHVLTASSIQQILAYVQASTLATKGDILTRTATAVVPQAVGVTGTTPIADPTQATGWRWGAVTGGAGAAHQNADYTIFFDGTNYHARNNATASEDVPTSNTSLHNVFNAAVVNAGPAGVIELAGDSPTMMTTQPLVPGTRTWVRGAHRGVAIQASGTAWQAGTLAVPMAIIDASNCTKVRIDSLQLNGAGIHGSGTAGNPKGVSGIVFTKAGGTGASYIINCEINDCVVSGIQVGKKGVGPNFSTDMWVSGNNVYSGSVGSPSDNQADDFQAFAYYDGDNHFLGGNNAKISGARAYCMYLEVGGVHAIGESHFANNNNICTNGLITVTRGGNNRFEGLYIDNLNNCPAFELRSSPSPATAISRTTILGNWIHNTLAINNAAPLIKIDATNKSCDGTVIIGNTSEGTAGLNASAIVQVNGATGNPLKSLTLMGNSVTNCTTFVTGTAAGPLGVGAGTNVITNGTVTVGP